MDPFIAETPFFTAEQRNLAASVAGFVEREVEARAAADEGGDVEASFPRLPGRAGEGRPPALRDCRARRAD